MKSSDTPRSAVNQTAGPTNRVFRSPPGPPIGILVLDDQETVRSLLRTGLQRSGFLVWVAASGQEAIELYSRHRADIQLVLLDVQMPGLDGPDTLAALRAINPLVCCSFLTGDMANYTEGQLLRMGARRVFYKPVRLTRLARSLGRLARHGQPSKG